MGLMGPILQSEDRSPSPRTLFLDGDARRVRKLVEGED